MPTSEQLKKWEDEHRRADKIYRARVNQFLSQLNASQQQVRPSELDFIRLPGAADALGQHFLTEPAGLEIDGQVICMTSLSSFNAKKDVNKFIINKRESILYKEILANADRFISEGLTNFDTEWFELLDGLAKNINQSLIDRGIFYKPFDFNERKQLRYPVFFTEENAKELFVCFQIATLQNAIIGDLIRKYKDRLPIKVFSLFNYFTNHKFQNPHRISLITDPEGIIIAIMEQDFVARPSNPTRLQQLFTPGHDGHRVIYRLGADGLPDAGYYLLHELLSYPAKPDITTGYKPVPTSKDIKQIEELKERFKEARERHTQQQGKPNPSVASPTTPSQNQQTS